MSVELRRMQDLAISLPDPCDDFVVTDGRRGIVPLLQFDDDSARVVVGAETGDQATSRCDESGNWYSRDDGRFKQVPMLVET